MEGNPSNEKHAISLRSLQTGGSHVSCSQYPMAKDDKSSVAVGTRTQFSYDWNLIVSRVTKDECFQTDAE
jgi:hypothetical protein